MALSDQEKRWRRWIANTWTLLNIRTINGAYIHHGLKDDISDKDNKIPYIIRGVRLETDRSSFFEWAEMQKDAVHNIWAKGKLASVDRIDADGDYELSNMRILSVEENSSLINQGVGNDVVAVDAVNVFNGEVKSFRSVTEAIRCISRGKKDGGFEWDGDSRYVGRYFLYSADFPRPAPSSGSPDIHRYKRGRWGQSWVAS